MKDIQLQGDKGKKRNISHVSSSHVLLTENQEKALDFQHHLSVTANAGAGKTMVLVRRFVEILLNTDARVDELVAITFTEKAAGELKKKIAELIGERIQTAESFAAARRLERIRDQLTSANICTIHAFCAMLLRQYPVEANVDAGFTVLEGVDQQILVQEAIQTTLELLLKTVGSPQEREEFLDVVRMLGQRRAQDYFGILLRKREQVERLLQKGGCYSEEFSTEEILQRWNTIMISSVSRQLEDGRWRESLERILLLSKGKKAPDVAALVHQWKRASSSTNKFELYQQIAKLVFTKDGTLRKELVGKDVDPLLYVQDEDVLFHHHECVGYLISSLDDPEALRANRILLGTTRTMLKTYRNILGTYEAKKLENSQLDFEDLQLKTRELLQREDIRKKLAEKFKFIMVDEYQDTNRLQYEIIRNLVSDFQSGNLFIVGDPKQSIYGFRNAEVEIFEATKKDIENSSGTSEQNASVTLPESFRLLLNIAAFVNRVFSKIMMDASRQFAIHYDALVKGRANTSGGKMELLLVPSETAETDDKEETGSSSLIADEITMIAQRITELVRTRYPIYDKRTESASPFQFKHAAILLRNRKYLGEVEKVLAAFDIPYVLSGGIGFYQTQEVLDFLNYFKFLLNLDDDVALVGVLRSPFFAISDAELFEISSVGNEESFWRKTQRYSRSGQATEFLQHSVRILLDDVEFAKRLPVPFLVHRIFTNTGWHGTVLGLTSGEQRIANVDKLLRLSREFTGRSFTTLYDFVERLKTLVEQEQREGQASMEAAGNRVQIMTIHSAKGLEFPVVFLPFCHQQFHYDRAPYIDSEFGIGYKVKDTNDLNKELTPSLYQFLRRRNREKIEEEEKRIFYVACTRARDALIISGQVNPEAKHSTYLRWVFEGLGIDVPLQQSGEIVFPESSIQILDRTVDKNQFVEIQHALKVHISFRDTETRSNDVIPKAPTSIVQVHDVSIEALQAQTKGEFFSATQIKTFLECPTKYFLKYHLGLPEENVRIFDFDEEEEPNDKILGELEGSLTHAVLQLFHDNGFAEQDVRDRVCALADANMLDSEERRGAMVEGVTNNILRFQRSLFGARVLSAKEAHVEYSLSALFEDDFLTGTIDRLYKDENGVWSIVDYKTDRIDKKDILIRSNIYKPQLAFYALLVRKHFRQENVPASLLFLRYPDQPIRYVFQNQDINEFESVVHDSIKKIKANDFSRNVELCDTCSFNRNGNCIVTPVVKH